MQTLDIDTIHDLVPLVGQTIAVSDWLTMTQERINLFAEATGDRQWIHTDPERAARESPYGATVAHGFLTLSLLSQFIKQTVRVREGYAMGLNYGLNRVRFPAAVRAGARIRASFTLESVESIPAGVQAVVSAIVEIDGVEKPGCAAQWVIRYHDAAPSSTSVPSS